MNSKLQSSRSNQSDRSHTRGVTISSKLVVALVVFIALLIASTAIGFSAAFDSGASSTGKTITETAYQTTTVDAASTYANQGLNPAQIYANANQSIVELQGVTTTTVNTFFGAENQTESILGSGFVVQYSNSFYIVTNYHVAGATSNLTVTFSNGDSYPAKVIGSDPYSDLAIVSSSQAPLSEFYPLSLTSSSSLQVGQYVLAIGNPYGLSGTMTFGIISQLGETIQDPTAGNFSVADVIQFSAPINPGNSGGVLLNANGSVVGIPTAIVSGSQGIGFAIPSNTIMRELPSLASTGSYNKHAYMGIEGVGMNYQLAKATGANVTYGVLIESIVANGPAAKAGLLGGSNTAVIEGQQYLVGGDIIVGINGTKIINQNALSSYLEEHAVAGQTINIEIIRSGHYMNVNLTLGARPPISS